ncbi:WGxxGxxG family protein [Amycolatopsis regifaucium]|uniref:WGxxGxxG family protein n=1 Tax=Amycolatopsis regifaucium TaxID=546365 RepID=UPI001FD037FE|nr:WGxxGxxG family protein [Amycolatopsis regifaucium]
MSAAIVLTGAVPADAAPAPAIATPAGQQADNNPNDPNDRNDRNDRNDSDGDNGLWGLLGLLGLLGLAGLVRREPKPGAMAGYPAAGPGTPPANTYPPAEPRQNPPGA